MAKSEFDFKEYQKWVDNIGIAQKDFDTWVKEFLLEQAQRVVRAAKLRTPVDTGALRASYAIGGQEIALQESYEDGQLKYNIDPENSTIESIANVGDNYEVVISNPMEYASYVEYGHHLKGQHPYMGRYMLTISVDEVMQALPSRFESQFKKWLKSKGVGD